MLKKLLFTLLPMALSANLTYSQAYIKNLAILDAFDIDVSFINDKTFNEFKNKNVAILKAQNFFTAMDNGSHFVPAMKSILAKYNIPPEFLYLSLAESHFLVRAYSSASASGLWQFIPSTARLYGLKIDEFVDERRDLLKSTEAAAKYLSELHNRFGKWYLVAIAYNCGEGKLSRAIKQAGSDDLGVLLDPNKKYIPLESRNHIRKIVSLAMMGNDEEFLSTSKYEFVLNRASAESITKVKVPAGESLQRIARLVDMPLSELSNLNRHLLKEFVPPYIKEYRIYIPYSKLASFKQNYKADPTQAIHYVYRVKAGDNLSKIAASHGVSVAILKEFNSLKSTLLKVGQNINIPNINPIKTHYIVKKGDTLDAIAKEFGISSKELQSLNNLKGSLIKVGEKLVLR